MKRGELGSRPRLLIVAPEASSDAAAALLAARIAARHEAHLLAAGRTALRAQDAAIVYDTSHLGQVGLWSVLLSHPAWVGAGRFLVRLVRSYQPEVLVLFACRRFHLSVLRAIAAYRPAVAWVYPPGDWVRSQDRDDEVLRAAELFVCCYEWHARRLEEQGARVVRVPHHSTLAAAPEVLAEDDLKALRPPTGGGPVVAAMPGSRPEEVRRLMPILARALGRLAKARRGFHAVISQAPGVPDSVLEPYLAGLPCTHVVSRLPVRVLAERVDAAAVCCGTAATEVAMADCPQVVVYRPLWITARVTQRFGRRRGIRFLSMINLGMDQRVVPELLARDCTPERVAAELGALLDESETVARMRGLYAQYRAAMSQGSWDDAADAIVGLARKG